ncbi:MAG: PD-(D/E)XK nuclease family protein [Deltaproteobacteria bacterium]|nr:PD-(D/E)XK nuclease family protein [Deltaproteobacteria bacterium]
MVGGCGRLLVVRDRAHARDALGALPPGDVVWTLGELFDRLAAWALLDPAAPPAVRDDDAALLACATALSARAPFGARLASEGRAVRASLVHGGSSATAAERALASSERPVGAELRWLVERLAHVERRLAAKGVVDGPAALSRAVARLERGELLGSVARFATVEVRGLVDPTDLETRAVLGLARAGARVTVVLPMDGATRGLLAGVEPLLAAVEAAHEVRALEATLDDLAEPSLTGAAVAPFVRAWYAADGAVVDDQTPVEVAVLADEAAEADEVARVVAAWKQASPKDTVAIALRAISGGVGDDHAAARLTDALARHGIDARVRRRPLADTAAARLVLDLLALRLHGAPRDHLLAVLANPARKGALSVEDAARVHRALRLAAARTDAEDAARPSGGYRHRLERFAAASDDPAARAAAQFGLATVGAVLEQVATLPLSAPLRAQLECLAALADTVVETDSEESGAEESGAAVCALLARLRDAATSTGDADDAPVALAAAARLVESALRAAQAGGADVDEHAPEILSLPELWGRRFDRVVVAGCVEGRLPRVERAERLLSDQERIAVNAALGRPVLRLLDDDPLHTSPVPRAQALEPVWMLGALRAAAHGMLLTAARRDGRGRELAPSVFLLEALRALGAAPDVARAGARFPRAVAGRERELRAATLRGQGRLDDDAARAAGIDRALLAHVDLARRMRDERARFFAGEGAASVLERRAPFAFAVEPSRMVGAFGHAFGLRRERPLAPTRLEALAECRWRGFLQHVLKVDVDQPAGNAADARVLGRLAHAVLERYFTERKHAQVPAARCTRADRTRLRALVAEEAAPVLAGRATGHLGAIGAQVAWLETALVRAVSVLAREPPVEGVEPSAFEVQIGVSTRERPADLEPVTLALGERTLWVGGAIDRVDEGPGGRSVLDYKSGASRHFDGKVGAAALFTTHFQLPLYLRLLEAHRPTAPDAPLHGYLVSVRDGGVSWDIGRAEELRARLLDDTRDDGLAAGIGRVLLPVLDGVLPPDANERCRRCRVRRVCRLPYDSEPVDDGDGGAS